MNFEGQTVIVTGAGSGIGRATALKFAALGASIAVIDINDSAASEVAQLAGPNAIPIKIDVSDGKEVQSMVDIVVTHFGSIDVLCNNAGIGFAGTVQTIEEDDWDRLMAVNLKSVYLCSKYCISELEKSGRGRIVNTASYTASTGIPGRAAYVASKGGIAALTRAMALDHVGQGIRVNAVAPGTVYTPYFDVITAESSDPVKLVDELKARSPMGRMGQPEEIAEAIVWLASHESSFATGSILTIDGGSSAW